MAKHNNTSLRSQLTPLVRGLLMAGCCAALMGINLDLAAADQPAKPARKAQAGQAGAKARRGKVVHVVCFKFKEDASKEQVRKVVKDFAALKGKVPQIATFEWGTNISPENLNKGFKHAFVLTFKTVEDRDAYLVHPEHKAFAKSLGGLIDDVFVIDYQARRR